MKRIALITAIILFGVTSAYAGSMSINTLAPAPVGNMTNFRLNPGTLPALPCRLGSFAVGSNNLLYACVVESGSNVWRVIMPFVRNGNTIYNLGKSANDYFLLGGSVDQLPEFRLSIYGEGGIISTGTYAGTDPVLTTSGAGTRFIWHTNKAAIRAGQVTGAEWDDGNIGAHTVGFGRNSEPRANFSSVLGGDNNFIDVDSSYSVIAGGLGNTMNDANTPLTGYNFLGGGQNNVMDGQHSIIVGGLDNSVPPSGANTVVGGENNDIGVVTGWAFIGGGHDNTAAGLGGVVVAGGGNNNVSAGLGYATVSGGRNNDIVPGDSSYSTIGGGLDNTVRLGYSVIGGGSANNIDNNWGTIGGGNQNSITDFGGLLNTIGGGGNNTADSNDLTKGAATVAGGRSNDAGDDYATVGGGRLNWATAEGATIGGGGGYDPITPLDLGNKASGTYSTISGGQNNDTTAGFSTVGGGRANVASGVDSTIGGGNTNTASATSSTIGGGDNNQASFVAATIGGGTSNIASNSAATVAGGNLNQATGNSAAVGGGAQNQATAQGSTVAGGNLNVASGINSTVIGGNLNNAGGVGSLAGGNSNDALGDYSVAMGNNNATDATSTSSVALGANMDIQAANTFAFGNGGTVTKANSFIIDTTFVGVGKLDPGDPYRMDILGDVNIDGDLYAFGAPFPSDERYKENVHLIENSLEKIQRLKGVTFEWNETQLARKKHIPKDIGILAQDVEKVFPELVRTNNAGYKSVDYMRLIAPLIEAVKELNEKLETLEQENEELRKALSDIQTD